jgi:hypothetical protein
VELAVGSAVLLLEVPLLCILGNTHPVLTTAGTLVLLLGAFYAVASRQAALMLVLSGVLGPFCEALPILVGAWSYPHPGWLGIPVWLPTGYALFGFAVVRVAFGIHGAAALMTPARAGVLVRNAAP